MQTIDDIRHARLLVLIKEHQSQAALARVISKSPAQISQWVNKSPNSASGKPRVMEGETAREIERLCEKPVGWMDQPLAATEQANIEPGPDLRPGTRVPVVGSVKGGADGYMEELQYPVGVGEGFVEYWTPDRSAYALRVKGDSMHPRYRAGEFIVVTPSIEPQPGRDVVVKLKDGQKLLKQLNWIRGGEVQLLSINNGYAPMTIDLEDVEAIQRVGGSVPPDAFCD
jgi:SOS-response transcriptional repressor LexA